MSAQAIEVIRVGDYALKLSSVASMHWSAGKLYVHQDGGRFLQLDGVLGRVLWNLYTRDAVDGMTGEVIGNARA